jgi:hypothetical protein
VFHPSLEDLQTVPGISPNAAIMIRFLTLEYTATYPRKIIEGAPGPGIRMSFMSGRACSAVAATGSLMI